MSVVVPQYPMRRRPEAFRRRRMFHERRGYSKNRFPDLLDTGPAAFSQDQTFKEAIREDPEVGLTPEALRTGGGHVSRSQDFYRQLWALQPGAPSLLGPFDDLGLQKIDGPVVTGKSGVYGYGYNPTGTTANADGQFYKYQPMVFSESNGVDSTQFGRAGAADWDLDEFTYTSNTYRLWALMLDGTYFYQGPTTEEQMVFSSGKPFYVFQEPIYPEAAAHKAELEINYLVATIASGDPNNSVTDNTHMYSPGFVSQTVQLSTPPPGNGWLWFVNDDLHVGEEKYFLRLWRDEWVAKNQRKPIPYELTVDAQAMHAENLSGENGVLVLHLNGDLYAYTLTSTSFGVVSHLLGTNVLFFEGGLDEMDDGNRYHYAMYRYGSNGDLERVLFDPAYF